MSVGLVSLLGLVLFVWPFVFSGAPPELPALGVTVASLAALAIMEIGARRLDSGRLALLAVLAAIDAALRLALVTGIGGFSPIFFLVILAGYAFGASYGFLVGAFSLLVSALVTGGVGPWLPYEAFAVGWVGVVAGVAGWLVERLWTARGSAASGDRANAPPVWLARRLDLAVLVAVAIVTGFAYGALTDVWDWVTFYRGVGEIGWLPGIPAAEALARFARFYLVTSFGWDALRAAGDTLAILVFGVPVLTGLARLRARLGYEIVPLVATTAAGAGAGTVPGSTAPSRRAKTSHSASRP